MRRTKLIASSVVIALVAVGSYVVADKPNTPVNDEVPVQETVQVEEVAEPVVEQEQDVLVTSQPVENVQSSPTPMCTDDVKSLIEQETAKIDSYKQLVDEARNAAITRAQSNNLEVDEAALEAYLDRQFPLYKSLIANRDRLLQEADC